MSAPYDYTISPEARRLRLERARALRATPTPSPSPSPAGATPSPRSPRSPRLALLAQRRPRSPTPAPRGPSPLGAGVWAARPDALDRIPSPRVLYPGGAVLVVAPPGGEAAVNGANAALIDLEWGADEAPDWPAWWPQARAGGFLGSPLSRAPWLWVWLPGPFVPAAAEARAREAVAAARASLDACRCEAAE